MELDENFKRLIDELGHAINDSLSESEAISEVMSRIRASGYDLFLILEVTIGFTKKDEPDARPAHRERKEPRPSQFQLTTQDAQFLRAMKISVEDRTS